MDQTFQLNSLEKTTELAALFARELSGGDTLLLSGSVGVGKTHFARQIILYYLNGAIAHYDIPSPTFTLVQTYNAADVDIWHADLYRLSSIDEIYELGLEDAFRTEICIVEWPDLLKSIAPKSALNMTFDIISDQVRHLRLEWSDPKWNNIIQTISKTSS